MVKTAVLVSGGGTNLQAILDKRGKVIFSADIALVVSNKKDAYALERAAQNGIRGEFISSKNFEEKLQALLEECKIEFVVLAGFLKILSPEFTAKWAGRIINIHPALIPSFCGVGMYGLHVHEAVLAYGAKVTGATVHYVNEVADGGRIISQKAVEVLEGDTPEILQRRVMEQAEWILLPNAVEQVAKLIENKVK